MLCLAEVDELVAVKMFNDFFAKCPPGPVFVHTDLKQGADPMCNFVFERIIRGTTTSEDRDQWWTVIRGMRREFWVSRGSKCLTTNLLGSFILRSEEEEKRHV